MSTLASGFKQRCFTVHNSVMCILLCFQYSLLIYQFEKLILAQNAD